MNLEDMLAIMEKWTRLANAVEEGMELSDDEVLVWNLSLTGGHPANPAMGRPNVGLPRAHAFVDLCKRGHLPHGAYGIPSPSSSVQETLISLDEAETTILTTGFVEKIDGEQTLENMTKELIRRLRFVKK